MVRSIRAACCAAAMFACVIAAGVSLPAAASAAVSVQSVSLWKQNASPIAWSANPDLVYYNAVGSDGMYEGYSANPDGSNPTCVTCTEPSFPLVGAATQRGVSDVSSNGQYMLLEVESPNHIGLPGESISEPGKGAYNNVWLASTSGSQEWQLTNVTAAGSGVIGTMWARFSPSGNQIVFDEMYAPSVGNLGYWQIVVANIVWNDGVPSLADQTVINPSPDHFMEPYGFSPDGSKIIFASDIDQPSWMDSQIWEINTDGTDLTRLSPEAPYGMFTDYNEFAFYQPSGDGIIYGSTDDSQTLGIDYWLMNPDGSGAQRLTFFNEPWSTESQGYTITGGLAFNPDNPNQFIASVSHDAESQTQDAVLMTLSDPSSAGGLAAQYYTNSTDFQGTPVTAVNNPSSGFETDGSPMPGVSSDDYSIQWNGSITPPSSGTYTFCLMTDGGGELYIAGALVVNASSALGQRVCGTTQVAAGQPLGVTIDYSHSQGDAYEQLTWIPPGAAGQLSAVQGGVPVDWADNATSGEIIPTSDMSPNGSGAPPPVATAPATSSGGTPAVQRAGSGGAVATIARAGHHAKSKKKKARKSARKPACKPAKKAANKSAKKPANKSAKKPANKSAKKPANKSAKKATCKSAKKPARKPAKKQASASAKKPAHKPAG
jgi:hypothetical protein